MITTTEDCNPLPLPIHPTDPVRCGQIPVKTAIKKPGGSCHAVFFDISDAAAVNVGPKKKSMKPRFSGGAVSPPLAKSDSS